MVEKKIPLNYCAPCSEGSKYKKNKGKKINKTTCYSLTSLLKIINAWNKNYTKNKIVLDNSKKNNKTYLWNLVQHKLSSSCHNNEKCWKRQEFIKKMKDTEIEFYTFKPDYPKEWFQNKYTWLNTYDILHVMKQYEKLYNNFMFLGPVPADCPTKINCELSNLNLTKLHKNGIDNVGIIYNLDMSYEGGSHWVYLENEGKLYIPRSYGIEKFGTPELSLLPPGKDININFNLKLKEEQKKPAEETIKAYHERGIYNFPSFSK